MNPHTSIRPRGRRARREPDGCRTEPVGRIGQLRDRHPGDRGDLERVGGARPRRLAPPGHDRRHAVAAVRRRTAPACWSAPRRRRGPAPSPPGPRAGRRRPARRRRGRCRRRGRPAGPACLRRCRRAGGAAGRGLGTLAEQDEHGRRACAVGGGGAAAAPDAWGLGEVASHAGRSASAKRPRISHRAKVGISPVTRTGPSLTSLRSGRPGRSGPRRTTGTAGRAGRRRRRAAGVAERRPWKIRRWRQHRPVLARDQRADRVLDLDRVGLGGPAEPADQPAEVRVDGDARARRRRCRARRWRSCGRRRAASRAPRSVRAPRRRSGRTSACPSLIRLLVFARKKPVDWMIFSISSRSAAA